MLRLRTLLPLVVLIAVGVQAQPVRTFVSTEGLDNASCSKPSPCRTIAAAINAVATSGEVVVLDSGGYSPFTVNKSVTVLAPAGVHAAVAPTVGNGITVDGSGIRVILRNLYVNSQGASLGIFATNFSSLFVEGISINGFFNGLHVDEAAASSREVFVTDCVSRNTSGAGPTSGMVFRGAAATFTTIVTVLRSRAENGVFAGFQVLGNNIAGTFSDCTASANSTGFLAGSGGRMTLQNCLSTNNTDAGVTTNGTGSVMRLSHSAVVDNGGAGMNNSAGNTFESLQNNLVRGNAPESQGTITNVNPM